jgi:hypothetical protein
MVTGPFLHLQASHGVILRPISLKSITAVDEAFLCQLYASTRAEEIAQIDWPIQQKNTFLAMQF